MADVKPSNYIAGIVIFALIVTSGVFILGRFHADNPYTEYGDIEQFNSTFNKAAAINLSVEGLRGNIEDSDPDPGAFGVLNALINTAWQGLRVIFTSFGFMNDVGNGLTSFFGVPAFMVGLVALLAVIMFVFAIWGALFQKDM